MKIALDIGGVISAYPSFFREFIKKFSKEEVYIITDMHNKDEVIIMLKDNNFDILEENVYCADYKTYGNMCKAILLRDLKIDMFIDDFLAYCQWDSSFGPAPIRLLAMPDPFISYWNDEWKVRGNFDFARRKYTKL